VDFVDNVNLISRTRRPIDGILAKLSNFIDSVVRCSVYFDDINIFADVYRNTAIALPRVPEKR